MARKPITFDFVNGRAYRSEQRTDDLTEATRKAITKRRVVKTVEGVPPQQVPQPQK